MKRKYISPEFDLAEIKITSTLLNDISSGEGSAGGGNVDDPGEGGFE